jgi:hypothetical protein
MTWQNPGRVANWSIGGLFVITFATYFLLRPPLFNYDGYTYRLEALEPANADYINPHHVLWYPVQKALVVATSKLADGSPEAIQIFGIAVTCVSLALFCLLLVRLTGRLLPPLAITAFIAFSPQVWEHALQNQPYPLLYLFLVLFFWTVSGSARPSARRLVCGGAALAAAVLFQQAMVLAIPAAALGLAFIADGPLKHRLVRYTVWTGSTLLLVAAAYITAAGLIGLGPSGFFGWTLNYLESQHSLQVDWLQSPAKSAMGIVRALLETSRLEDLLIAGFPSTAVYWLYYILLLAGCLFAAAASMRKAARGRIGRAVQSRTLVATALPIALVWGIFAFLWEPSGYYWSLELFPAGLLLALWLRESRPRTVRAAVGLLVALSAWNIFANCRRDRAYSINYPPPLIRQIEQQLSPRDMFIVAGREWYGDLDWDLLLQCLGKRSPNPGKALLDDFVMPGRERHRDWRPELERQIQTVWQAGGRVFVADHVLSANTYSDLPQTASPLSEYERTKFAGVDAEKLSDQIEAFFDAYGPVESPVKIGTNRFRELKLVRLRAHSNASGNERSGMVMPEEAPASPWQPALPRAQRLRSR